VAGALLLAAAAAVALHADAQEAEPAAVDAPSPVATEKDYETLRRLLGLPQPEPASSSPASSEPAPLPASPEPATAEDVAPEEPPAALPSRVVAPVRPKVPAAAAKPAAPKRAPRAVVRSEPAKEEAAPAAAEVPAAHAAAPVETVDLPAPGTTIDAKNLARWKHLLGPSIQWSVERGASLQVALPSPAPIEPLRDEATQRYHAQVRLTDDKLAMQNYVAGIPFPLVQDDDPDLAIKLMFNYESRGIVDDVDIRRSTCDTGSLDEDRGFHVEKHYEPEHFRRLFYVSRLFHAPMPTWPTVDGVRYREVAGPLTEPFDLKGAGYTYARYLAPSRQDDSWVYYPSSRRLRRLSTAQRSEGIFGQDIDLDSFAGFAGNPAWTVWKYLGKKTILAPMHARHVPVKFLPPPVDYFPDESWEPREVHVMVGTSKLRGNSFSRRVLYMDREALLIPLVELYDMNGGLWKGMLQTWTDGSRVKSADQATRGSNEPPRMASISLFDMQLAHVTRCELPSSEARGEQGWYFNGGADGGTTEEEFTVSGLIARAR
jgi:hypothetical protein